MRTLLRTTALLLATACYDASVHSGQIVTCADPDHVCPRGRQCQLQLLECVESDDHQPASIDGGSVTYAAVPDVAVPVALGAGGTATVHFTTSELVLEPKLLTNPALDCTPQPPADRIFAFDCRPAAGVAPSEGSVTVQAQLEDVFGNESTVALPSIALDTVAPAAPDVNTPSRIVYRRVPWGSRNTMGAPRFEVSGELGAVEPNATVVAAGEDVSGPADAGGAFGPIIFQLDVAETLGLVAVDGAGNRSARAGVRDFAWVATLEGKVLGSSAENPHRLVAYPVHGRGLQRADGFERVGAARSYAGWSWEAPVESLPDAGLQPLAAAYDMARGRVVGVGRSQLGSPNPITNEIREGASGLRRHVEPLDPESDSSPSARLAFGLAYDEERRRTVLFGGRTGPNSNAPVLGETWLWDGRSWELATPSTPPRPRADHHLAYDARRGRTVLFGGTGTDGGPLYDTWEWDGTKWDPRDAGSGSLPSGGPMTYDRHAGLVYQVDGTGRLWSWDGDRWTLIPAMLRPPAARAIATDEARGVLVALAPGAGPQVDTWEWDGGQWRQGPLVPFSNDLVYDPEQGAVTLGQVSNGVPLKWTGATWEPLPIATPAAPPSRAGAAMAYWPMMGVWAVADDQTWAWNGSWERVNAGTLPARRQSAMVFDQTGNRLELVGGRSPSMMPLDETWHLTGGASWQQQNDGDELTQSSIAALAPVMGGTVAILGRFNVSPKLYVRRGMNPQWNQVTSGSNPASEAQQLKLSASADGAATGMFVHYDGGHRTFTFFVTNDGGVTRETQMQGTPTPQYDRLPALFFDASRGRTVAIGGAVPGQLGPNRDLWELRGEDWVRGLISDPEGDGEPALGADISAAHHTMLQRSVVLDELEGGGTGWLLRSANARPSLVFTVALGAAQFPRGAEYQSVRAEMIAGATSRQGDGARVQLWLDGAWVDQMAASASNRCAPDAGQVLQFAETDPVRLRSLLSHQPELAVAVVPLDVTGRSDAVVAAEAVEVTVRYRR